MESSDQGPPGHGCASGRATQQPQEERDACNKAAQALQQEEPGTYSVEYYCHCMCLTNWLLLLSRAH